MLSELFAYNYSKIRTIMDNFGVTHCYIQPNGNHSYSLIAFCKTREKARRFKQDIDELFPYATTSRFLAITYVDDPAWYEFYLMTELPENNLDKAEIGKLYLSENGDYATIDRWGKAIMGSLKETNIDLKKLTEKLKDPAFKKAVLEIISTRGHTYPKVLQNSNAIPLEEYVQKIIVRLASIGDFAKLQEALKGAPEFIYVESFRERNSVSAALEGLLRSLSNCYFDKKEFLDRIKIVLLLHKRLFQKQYSELWQQNLAVLLAQLPESDIDEQSRNYIIDLINHIVIRQSELLSIRAENFISSILEKAIVLTQNIGVQRPYYMSAIEKWHDAKQQLLEKLETNYPELLNIDYLQQAIIHMQTPEQPLSYDQYRYGN